jgi:hypothetical protein
MRGCTRILWLSLIVLAVAACQTQDQVADSPTPEPASDSPTSTPTTLEIVIRGRQPAVKDESISPDQRWRSQVLRYECIFINPNEEMAYELLRLSDMADRTVKVIADQLQACGGLGAAGLEVITWSRNSRFLYFTDAAEGVPDGAGFWERSMIAYDLETGEREDIGIGKLAPDKPVVAFWQLLREQGEYDLLLWDLEQGEAGRFSPVETGWYRGPIAWSPDGSQLVFIETDKQFPPYGESLVALVLVETGEVRTLLSSSDPVIIQVEWAEPDQLTLTDSSTKIWKYEISIGELIEIP